MSRQEGDNSSNDVSKLSSRLKDPTPRGIRSTDAEVRIKRGMT